MCRYKKKPISRPATKLLNLNQDKCWAWYWKKKQLYSGGLKKGGSKEALEGGNP